MGKDLNENVEKRKVECMMYVSWESIVQCALAFDLAIVNTYFKKQGADLKRQKS